MGPPSGEISFFCFIKTRLNFLLYHMQNIYLHNILGVMRGESRGFLENIVSKHICNTRPEIFSVHPKNGVISTSPSFEMPPIWAHISDFNTFTNLCIFLLRPPKKSWLILVRCCVQQKAILHLDRTI